MAKALVVGNWKMYVNSLAEAKKLVRDIDRKLPRGTKATVVVCPPMPFVAALREAYRGRKIAFGAQDCFFKPEGAHTGEASPRALAKAGIEYVILGHSEQRALGETNETVGKKVAAALAEKLKPIICVSERERDANGGYLNDFKKDIVESLSRAEAREASKITIAYEPVWAIGGEEPPPPHAIMEMSIFIRKTLAGLWGREAAFKVRIIYGGSVNAANASAIAKEAKVSGVLPGHHSVNADSFTSIVRAFS
jgi:triosephosphate isomerase